MSEPMWCNVTIALPPVGHPAWEPWKGEGAKGNGEPQLVKLLRDLSSELWGDGHCDVLDNEWPTLQQWAGCYVQMCGEANYGLNVEIQGILESLVELGVAFDANDEDKYDMAGETWQFRPGMSEPWRRVGVSSTGEPYVPVRKLVEAAEQWRTVEDALAWVLDAVGPTPIIDDSDVAPRRWIVDAQRLAGVEGVA